MLRCWPALALVVASSAAAQTYIPEQAHARGDQLRRTLTQTVCVSGWTTTIRPPAAYANGLKVQQIRELRLPSTPHDYEDHLVPLCAGGHPSDLHNLWRQPLEGQ